MLSVHRYRDEIQSGQGLFSCVESSEIDGPTQMPQSIHTLLVSGHDVKTPLSANTGEYPASGRTIESQGIVGLSPVGFPV
jgi:hypothetical protein